MIVSEDSECSLCPGVVEPDKSIVLFDPQAHS